MDTFATAVQIALFVLYVGIPMGLILFQLFQRSSDFSVLNLDHLERDRFLSPSLKRHILFHTAACSVSPPHSAVSLTQTPIDPAVIYSDADCQFGNPWPFFCRDIFDSLLLDEPARHTRASLLRRISLLPEELFSQVRFSWSKLCCAWSYRSYVPGRPSPCSNPRFIPVACVDPALGSYLKTWQVFN